MILNEDYFEDIEITDDDIESSKEDSADVILKYDKPSDWFTNEINGKYFACLYIPVDKKNYNKWKQIMPYIQKRLYYLFTAYGAECYSPEQIILQDELYNYFNGYVGCVFKDFHEYKIISEHPYKEYMYIYMPVFFNFPKTLSYRVVCKLISSIIKFLWSDKMSGYLEFHGIVFRTKYCLYYIYKQQKNRIVNINDIVNIIHLSLGIDKDIIKDKLYANNRELLCKIWKYFYPDLKYLRPKHPKWVDEIRSLMA